MATDLTASQLYRNPDVIRETEKALCVRITRVSRSFNQDNAHRGNDREVWLPKSQVEFRSDVYGEQLFVPAWLLGKLA